MPHAASPRHDRRLSALLAALMLTLPAAAAPFTDGEIFTAPSADGAYEMRFQVTDAQRGTCQTIGRIDTIGNVPIVSGAGIDATLSLPIDVPAQVEGLSVTAIGTGTFYHCDRLTQVTLPDAITAIGDDAFNGCRSLASVPLAEGITAIGHRAFDGCSALPTLHIPASVTSIGNYALRGLTGATSLTVAEGNTRYWSGDNDIVVDQWVGYVIAGCVASVLPEGVTGIGPYAFSGIAIEQVTLPSSLTSIGVYAFDGATLARVTSLILQPFTIPANAFSSRPALTVPYGTKALYEAAEGWSQCFATIDEMAPPTVEAIALTPGSLTVDAGETFELRATLSPADIADDLTWTSDDPTICRIIGSDVPEGAQSAIRATAEAVGVGTTTLRVRSSNGLEASCQVTVEAVTIEFDYTIAMTRTGGDEAGGRWHAEAGSGTAYTIAVTAPNDILCTIEYHQTKADGTGDTVARTHSASGSTTLTVTAAELPAGWYEPRVTFSYQGSAVVIVTPGATVTISAQGTHVLSTTDILHSVTLWPRTTVTQSLSQTCDEGETLRLEVDSPVWPDDSWADAGATVSYAWTCSKASAQQYTYYASSVAPDGRTAEATTRVDEAQHTPQRKATATVQYVCTHQYTWGGQVCLTGSHAFEVTAYRRPTAPQSLVVKGGSSNKSGILIATMPSAESGTSEANGYTGQGYRYEFGYTRQGESPALVGGHDDELRYAVYTPAQMIASPWVRTYWTYDDGHRALSETVGLTDASRTVMGIDVITADKTAGPAGPAAGTTPEASAITSLSADGSQAYGLDGQAVTPEQAAQGGTGRLLLIRQTDSTGRTHTRKVVVRP